MARVEPGKPGQTRPPGRDSRMARSAHGSSRLGYLAALAMLVLAILFPIGLMVFNPTLMFERGWEQYVGTAIYFWAVLTLGRELWTSSGGTSRPLPTHPGCSSTSAQCSSGQGSAVQAAGPTSTARLWPRPTATDASCPSAFASSSATCRETHAPSAAQLMEVNRETSGLDQEHMAGRFTLTRYILYLLPVIGFIGTVEGISKALMNISKVLAAGQGP